MDSSLPYHVIRTRRRKRTLSLCIEKDGTVLIRVPWRTPTAEIERFFVGRKAWIRKKLAERSLEPQEHGPKAFVAGETFLYLGGSYPLEIVQNGSSDLPFRFVDERFLLREDHRASARELFVNWYKREAESIIRRRLKAYGDTMEISPRRERISSARYRWGGCSSKDVLSFSWRLVMAPMGVVDYVVVHELAHVREKNHSPRFWRLVETTLPDYSARRDWLKKHGDVLTL